MNPDPWPRQVDFDIIQRPGGRRTIRRKRPETLTDFIRRRAGPKKDWPKVLGVAECTINDQRRIIEICVVESHAHNNDRTEIMEMRQTAIDVVGKKYPGYSIKLTRF